MARTLRTDRAALAAAAVGAIVACSDRHRDGPESASVATEDAAESTSDVTLHRWWTDDAPCPGTATLRGRPEADAYRVWCETSEGVQHGRETRFHEYLGGGPREEFTYVDGIRKGRFTAWYENGSVAERGRYVVGKRIGTWTTYHEGGGLASRGKYKNGLKTGVWKEWHENGQLASQGRYRAGKAHGPWTEWHYGGTLKSKGEYRNDLAHGEWTTWSRQETLLREERFVRGRVVEQTLYPAPRPWGP